MAAGRHRRRALAGPDPRRVVALTLVGLLALPSYKPSYDDRNYLPPDIPANVGYAAAERHFPRPG